MTTNNYKTFTEVVGFLKDIDPEEMNSVQERKLNAMYEVLHNMRKSIAVIPLSIVESFIKDVYEVKDMERPVSIDPDDLDRYFKSVITRRLYHCAANLISKYGRASRTPSGEYVMFDDNTHFSKPVYEALLSALETHHEEWLPIVWQQIVRQMHSEHSTDDEMFDIATEFFLVADPHCDK